MTLTPPARALLACALLALCPASAAAAQVRYVSPAGPASGACAATAPCSIAWALSGGGSDPGDTVFLAPGTYPDQPLSVDRPLFVTAAADRPRPVLRATAPDAVALTVAEGAAGSVLEHFAIRAEGERATGVDVRATASLSDLTVRSATGPCLRSDARGLRIDDSDFRQTGAGTGACLQTSGADTDWNGVTAAAPAGETAADYAGDGRIDDATLTARGVGLHVGGDPAVHRVTARGGQHGVVLTGSVTLTDTVAVARRGGDAVLADGGRHQVLHVTAWARRHGAVAIRAAGGADLIVTNTIARGTDADLVANPAAPAGEGGCDEPAGCSESHITADHSNFRLGLGVTDGGANQSSSPRFADPGSEDFHLRRGSPAVDAGTYALNSSSADRDGRFRLLGAHPDLGAYERPTPRPGPARADRKAPTLGVVRLTAPVFRVAPRGLAFSASGAPVGTTLVFVVSEDADLVAQVFRPGGRRSVGTIVHAAPRGTRRLYLSGRVGGRPLPAGRYVLVVMARDVAQNFSAPRRLAFTVVR